MRSLSLCRTLTGCLALSSAESYSQSSPGQLSALRAHSSNEAPTFGRRKALHSILSGTAFVAVPAATKALDMDAFVSGQLEADQKNCDPKRDPKCIPKLTSDEALCKYGQSGNARAEACKKVKAAGGELPTPGTQGKSLGGAYAI